MDCTVPLFAWRGFWLSGHPFGGLIRALLSDDNGAEAANTQGSLKIFSKFKVKVPQSALRLPFQARRRPAVSAAFFGRPAPLELMDSGIVVRGGFEAAPPNGSKTFLWGRTQLEFCPRCTWGKTQPGFRPSGKSSMASAGAVKHVRRRGRCFAPPSTE